MRKGIITSTTKYEVRYWVRKESLTSFRSEWWNDFYEFSHIYCEDTEDIAFNLAEQFNKRLLQFDQLFNYIGSFTGSTFYEKKNGSLIITNDYRVGGLLRNMARIRYTYLIKSL